MSMPTCLRPLGSTEEAQSLVKYHPEQCFRPSWQFNCSFNGNAVIAVVSP
ncbi:MAG TPA: hypothetical protein V6D16_13870 [Candidatus Obscuribacterales bacterium]